MVNERKNCRHLDSTFHVAKANNRRIKTSTAKVFRLSPRTNFYSLFYFAWLDRWQSIAAIKNASNVRTHVSRFLSLCCTCRWFCGPRTTTTTTTTTSTTAAAVKLISHSFTSVISSAKYEPTLSFSLSLCRDDDACIFHVPMNFEMLAYHYRAKHWQVALLSDVFVDGWWGDNNNCTCYLNEELTMRNSQNTLLNFTRRQVVYSGTLSYAHLG